MPTQVNALKMRVQFQSAPGEAPSEVWTLSSEPGGFELDEQALDEGLFEFARATGHPSTFMFSRTYATGGWGASGLSVMDVVVTVALNVLSNAAYDGLVALYRKFAGRDPDISRTKPSPVPASAPRKGRPKKPLPRKPKRKH